MNIISSTIYDLLKNLLNWIIKIRVSETYRWDWSLDYDSGVVIWFLVVFFCILKEWVQNGHI